MRSPAPAYDLYDPPCPVPASTTLFARQARAAPVVVFLFRAEKRSFKLAESG